MEVMTRDEALEELAKRLHSKMEHLEPTDASEWIALTCRQKDFYRTLIEEICLFPDLVSKVIKDEPYQFASA